MTSKRIRSLVFAAGLLGLASCGSPPPDIDDADKDAIRAQVDAYVRGALAGDVKTWSNALAEDIVLMPPNSAPVLGRQAAVNWMGGAFPRLTRLTMEVRDVSGVGDFAYARGIYSLGATRPDGTPVSDSGPFLQVHRRTSDGKWPYIRLMWHSGSIPLPIGIEAVRSAVTAHWDAVNRGDLATVRAQHAPGMTVTTANFEKPADLDLFGKAKTSWQLLDLKVVPLGSNAMLATFVLDGSVAWPGGRIDRRPRRVSEVWVSQGSGWQEVHHHDSVVGP